MKPLVVLLSLFLLGLNPAGRADDAFFRPSATVIPEGEALYPKGRGFICAFYSIGGGRPSKTAPALTLEERRAIQKQFRAMGVNLLGPQYELDKVILEDAEAGGFGVIYTVGLPMDFHGKKPLKLDPAEITAGLAKQVGAVADNQAIQAWYLQPEELRGWRKNEVAYLHAAIAGIRQADPSGRPVFVYDPGHRNAEALQWIAEQTDWLAKGTYTNYSGMKDQRAWVRWSMEQETEALRLAGKAGVPLLVPEMFQEPAPEETALIPAWVRHDLYLGLVSGAKGLLVFSARVRPNFPSYALYRDAYAAVLGELTGDLNLAQVFLWGEKRDDLTLRMTSGPATVAVAFPAKEPVEYPSVSMANLAHGPDRYLILVNSSPQPVTASVDGLPAVPMAIEDLLEKKKLLPASEGPLEIRLEPLGVKAFRLSKK